MADVHAGSWFGLPDFGITEAIGNALGSTGRTAQGGSNLVSYGGQPTALVPTGTGGYQQSTSQGFTSGFQGGSAGGSTSSGGGGGGSTGSYTTPSMQQSRPQAPSQMGPTEQNQWAINNGYTGWNDYLNNQASQQQGQSRPWNDQYGMYEDQVQQAINDMYGGTQNYLNQAEAAVKGNLPGQLGEITSAADLQRAKLGEGRQSTLDTIAANERGAQTRKEDALAAARRLYQELGQANVQRFGGSTSAGQAMSELQGREQQSQMGQTARQYNEFMNQAATQKATLDREYQTGLQTIESEKQKATNAVNQAFQQSLLDIARDRATNESAKAQARLSALQDLRNKMFQITQQETQFKQSLEAQKQAAQLQIENYLKTQGAASTGINNAYSQFNAGTAQALNPQTKYAIQNMGVGTLQQPMYIGSIGKSITGRDEKGNYIYSDGTTGPGGFLNQ